MPPPLDRRQFLQASALTAAALALPRCASAQPAAPAPGAPPAISGGAGASGGARKPNVIFILCDDLGYGEVGCFGQKKIKTPNIDRLAAEGMRFTQSYCGSTVSAPSRCALLTGYHTGHAYIRGNKETQPEGQEPLPEGAFTVGRLFKQAGYATACIGKWGLGMHDTTGSPAKQGFDHFFGYLCQRKAHEYYPPSLWRNGQKVELDGKTWSHDLIAGEALDFVRQHKDQPFFLYFTPTIPHAKYQVPSDAPYENEDWPATEKHLAAMITRLDGDVGRLMALLKELGLDDHTLVFFASDNGAGYAPKFFQGSGPLRGMKRDLYEGGIRSPSIARWPGKIKPGVVSDHVWAFWDFLPTMAELIGVKAPPPPPPPEGIDGISFLPALLGQPCKEHDYLYWEFYERGFSQAVRQGNWKAVRPGPAPGKPIELYDLKTDLGEQNDLAGKHPEVVQKMAELMRTARVDSKIWATTRPAATRPAATRPATTRPAARRAPTTRRG